MISYDEYRFILKIEGRFQNTFESLHIRRCKKYFMNIFEIKRISKQSCSAIYITHLIRCNKCFGGSFRYISNKRRKFLKHKTAPWSLTA